MQKGGLHHVAKLVLADGVDTTHSGRGFDVVSVLLVRLRDVYVCACGG